MYYCPDCGYEFEKPKKFFETHGLSTPPFEAIAVCPDCGGNNFYEKTSTHCRCCGAKLSESFADYCSDSCRKRGIIMWQRQQRRRKLIQDDPIALIVQEIEIYNKENQSRLSYGQYVELMYRRNK